MFLLQQSENREFLWGIQIFMESACHIKCFFFLNYKAWHRVSQKIIENIFPLCKSNALVSIVIIYIFQNSTQYEQKHEIHSIRIMIYCTAKVTA